MILNKIEDPRDNLEKATRRELFLFAREQKVNEISDEMPAILMRDILRRRGLTRIRVPPRPLGAMSGGHASAGPAVPEANGVEADAIADLARQWAQQARAPEAARMPSVPSVPASGKPVALATMDINALRRICKAEGIPMGRRDRMPDLVAKIEAKRNGQDAA